MSQKGRHIGDIVLVLDLENLSYQKHCYWPCNLHIDYISFYSDISHTRTYSFLFPSLTPCCFPLAFI